MLPIAALSPDPANVRAHGSKNLSAIKASLARFGQQKPIVCDANNIIRAGNGTFTAAQSLGWSEIWAVRSDLPATELAAFAIADNRSAELAEWDRDSLASQLDALAADGFNLDDLGFDAADLAALTGPAPSPAAEAPDPPSDQTAAPDKFFVIVTCRDEADQIAFLDQMDRETRECRALVQ